MSKYDDFRKELRSVIEHYPKETCPVCLNNKYDSSVSARSANPTQNGGHITIPVCSSCKNRAETEKEVNGRTFPSYDQLSEYLGFMTHFAVYSSTSTQLDTSSMSGKLQISNITIIEDDSNNTTTLRQYILNNKDRVDILLEEKMNDTLVALMYNNQTDQLIVIYTDSGVTLILDDISIEASENSDPCCIKHLQFKSINGILHYMRERKETSVWDIKHMSDEFKTTYTARNI
jgi:hypothetical protein